jgi:hypothetical protein
MNVRCAESPQAGAPSGAGPSLDIGAVGQRGRGDSAWTVGQFLAAFRVDREEALRRVLHEAAPVLPKWVRRADREDLVQGLGLYVGGEPRGWLPLARRGVHSNIPR